MGTGGVEGTCGVDRHDGYGWDRAPKPELLAALDEMEAFKFAYNGCTIIGLSAQ